WPNSSQPRLRSSRAIARKAIERINARIGCASIEKTGSRLDFSRNSAAPGAFTRRFNSIPSRGEESIMTESRYPNETRAYRAARKALLKEEKALAKKVKAV